MNIITKGMAVLGTVALVTLSAGSAQAAPAEELISNPAQQAQGEANFYDNVTGTESTDVGYTRWSHGGVDSPLDRQNNHLKLYTPAAEPEGNYFNLFYSERSTSQNTLVGNEKNMSFDIRTNSSDGGGAPRISVEFSNGDVAYLASQFCKRTLTIDIRWSRADFTGAKHNCEFNVTGDTGGVYAADGSRSAWRVYADANPEQRVSQAYIVTDAPGTYHLDRIALGTAWMYTSHFNVGVRCLGDETRC
jgi:hypothetical protein